MNMIVRNVQIVDDESFPLGDDLEDSLELLFNITIGHCVATIPGGPNQVVSTTVNAVVKLVEPAIGHNKITSSLRSAVILLYRYASNAHTS